MQSVKKVRGSKAAVTRTEEFGMLCNPIVEECARNAVASPSTMGARKVSIDMTAVVRAEDDLRSVTAMMATEDAEEPEEEAPALTGSARADDPWTALSAMLDEDERGYLSSALEGNGRRYGPKASRLEDSINGKAIDAMGDSIVEDGAVVPDYIDDVRRMLR